MINEKRCYICLESNGLLLENICNCKTLYVHRKCLFNYIKFYRGSKKCQICKKKYKIKNNFCLSLCIDLLYFASFIFYLYIVYYLIIFIYIFFSKIQHKDIEFNYIRILLVILTSLFLSILFLVLHNVCKYMDVYFLL